MDTSKSVSIRARHSCALLDSRVSFLCRGNATRLGITTYHSKFNGWIAAPVQLLNTVDKLIEASGHPNDETAVN